jgi:LPXTG-motif cell wall-anchored protein
MVSLHHLPHIYSSPTKLSSPPLPTFGTGLGALGLLGWRRKKKAIAA